ncbi:MAG TPA: isoprenylcysteine carboxylmethyltransferase family protein [Candidatus Polarisedimenticolia bacterium]|nr:isoprenylcysteine carboxylmethyltransferase family protein [Candidatus Polarisedimenticolia bacterium]
MIAPSPQARDAALVFLGWLLLGVILLLRPRGEKGPERRRDRASLAGMVLQGVSFGIVWGIQPARIDAGAWPGALDAASVLRTFGVASLLVASLLLARAAVRTLGKQWSITARVLESHRLVTEGPYRFVRHPIYTAMLGMLLATGVALSRWEATLVAIPLYAVGTLVRIRAEERLLRETFGAEYEAYIRRVGAFVPRPARPETASGQRNPG